MKPLELAQQLTAMRAASKLSTREAAKLAQISHTYLWQLEQGGRTPSARVLDKLAGVYAVPTEHLMRIAGILTDIDKSDAARIMLNKALELVMADPDFATGTYITPEEITDDVKRLVIRAYEQVTGKKLL
mgnify:FL=1